MPAPEKYPGLGEIYGGDIPAQSHTDEGEDRSFNVITLVLLSFFVGAFWGVVGMAIWYSFNP